MSDRTIIYQEIIPQDRIYCFVMIGVLILLAGLTAVFIVTRILQGAISTGLTLIFLIFLTMTTREGKLIVTDQEFIMKFWFFTFKTRLSDISAIEIKDVSLLPEPYRGHIKFWVRGIKFFDGLRVLRLRDGDAVHIRTKKGQTIIVTPENNEKLSDILKGRICVGD